MQVLIYFYICTEMQMTPIMVHSLRRILSNGAYKVHYIFRNFAGCMNVLFRIYLVTFVHFLWHFFHVQMSIIHMNTINVSNQLKNYKSH